MFFLTFWNQFLNPHIKPFFWPEPIYWDINFVLKCLPAQCVTIFNLDQHSTQGNYLGQIFSPVSYHRPIIRNTNILSNSRTAHYLRPNVFNFSRTPQSAINAMSALQGMLGINQVRHWFGLTIKMITIFRETLRVCWVPTAACRI